MTNHWIDVRNSDCVLIMGANPAENHPVAFRWILEAKARGATIVCVDPRFTRSASAADLYAPIRSGTDIAFLGGLIRHVLATGRADEDFLRRATNASFLVRDEFSFDEEAGLFSGWDAAKGRYDRASWQYVPGQGGDPARDPTFADPRCVLRRLEKHYARYDLDRVSAVTGTPRKDLERVYDVFAATGAKRQVGTVLYAMGFTQHSTGTQTIRAIAILQSLLGNIGRAGGGVNALRGESNVQGSTDHGLLYDTWPGYLRAPRASQPTLASWIAAGTPPRVGPRSVNGWGAFGAYGVSYLKAMFGDAAARENEFGYSWLPKVDDGQDLSWLSMFDAMHAGKIRGFFAWGQNPACSTANAKKAREALARLDWLVNVNLFPSETGWFFEDPGLGRKPSEIPTEVFVLPAAASVEKEGSLTNSGRWMQWRYKASDPPGEALPDSEIMGRIFREVRRLYAEEGGRFPEPILHLALDAFDARGAFDARAAARKVSGTFLADVEFPDGKRFARGDPVPGPAHLKDDGTTLCGNWLYCGSYGKENLAARRRREAKGIGLHPEWAWAWPGNRRILYNRASVDESGAAFDPDRPTIAWQDGRWVGDAPDGAWPPEAIDPAKAKDPFVMRPEGLARLFAPDMKDGPLPEHYEPVESPLSANPFHRQRANPLALVLSGEVDGLAVAGGSEFPYVCTTYRVTEHWQTGVMSRHMPWLLELQPQVFVELDPDLAAAKGIAAGDRVRVVSRRGAIVAVALPTPRLSPLLVAGKRVHQVGLPWCFGWLQPAGGMGGDSANCLTPSVGDATTGIPETKAFLVDLVRVGGPLPGGGS